MTIKCAYVFLISPAGLNEELVQLLVLRDELHMEQDAMLVDIEDLTRSENFSFFFLQYNIWFTVHPVSQVESVYY